MQHHPVAAAVAALVAGRDPQRLASVLTETARLRALRLCEDCRVVEMTAAALDPYAGPERPRTITTDDYLRKGEE